MASLLVVGADHLGHITNKLERSGFREIIHLNGRKVNMVKRDIPEHVDAILVMIDYVNHNLAKKVKEKAKSKDKPIYFAKRSWSSINAVLEQLGKHA
ncbi:dihydroorotate dehydrogenase [Geobacillus stearothermophilus 10]|nr:dihydroorotate dehydrogenase [Geobacillus stearothermophilus 10]